MTYLKNAITAICLIISLHSFGQTDLKQEVPKNSISLNILGTGTYMGISYERLFAQRVSAEVGIGIIGIGIGATYYPIQKVRVSKLNPYIGIKYTNHAVPDGVYKSATYIPLGFTFYTRSSMNVGVDIGPSYFRHKSASYFDTEEVKSQYPFSEFGIWGNIKLGWRF